MSRDIWDPRRYRAYSTERARPFFELLARVDRDDPGRQPGYVVDLGCGPGERTADLAARWPNAIVEGIDDSAGMIAEARRLAGPRLRFAVADLATWEPDRPVDVIFSNAALHWVPGHQRLLARWVAALAPGGRLAFAIPGNFGAPSHVILRELCESPRWRDRLAGRLGHDVTSTLEEYLELLAGLGCRVDAWETTYLQVLQGDDPVLGWLGGTALRPVLDALPAGGERDEFLTELRARLRTAYPRRPFGTVFPFRRVFVVAARDADGPQDGPAGPVAGLHHVQLAAPAGSEPLLRDFYAGVLGLTEVPKPADLAARGGAWFGGPGFEIHIGVEDGFRPARKAHPGILVHDLDGLADRLRASGHDVRADDLLPGFRRFYADDPVGNRLEFLQPAGRADHRAGATPDVA